MKPSAWLDHLVVAITDLDVGLSRFEELTGVTPVRGGEHPTLGTHNALVSLGSAEYLEIVAPRPGAELSPLFREAADHDVLTPIMWAVATDDLARIHEALRAAGFTPTEMLPGSRRTRTGQTLRWSMFMMSDGSPRNAPFFIEWDRDTRHPASSSPGGCALRAFRVGSTLNEELARLLMAAGVDVSATISGSEMVVELDTPRGAVELSG